MHRRVSVAVCDCSIVSKDGAHNFITLAKAQAERSSTALVARKRISAGVKYQRNNLLVAGKRRFVICVSSVYFLNLRICAV